MRVFFEYNKWKGFDPVGSKPDRSNEFFCFDYLFLSTLTTLVMANVAFLSQLTVIKAMKRREYTIS